MEQNRNSMPYLGYKQTKEHKEKIGISRVGKKHSEETKRKMSLAQIGIKNHMWGKKRTEESRKKISEKIAREKHPFWGKFGESSPNWKGGLTRKNAALRNTFELKLWRNAIYKRDNFSCVFCGYKSKGLRPSDINADHIKSFAHFPELRFELSNGRTLCVSCHRKTDTYAGKSNKSLFKIN